MSALPARIGPICIDARMLHGRGTGVGTYATTLLRVLSYAGIARILLTDGGKPHGASGLLRRWSRAAMPGIRRAVRSGDGREICRHDLFREAYRHFRLYRRLLEVECDGPAGVMHFTYPLPIRLVGWRNLYTVHDAIPLTHPELTSIDHDRHLALLRGILATGSTIVTVSESSRAEIAGVLRCDAERIVNLGQATDVIPRLPSHPPAPLAAGRYLLFCGSIEPRKNLVRLVEAYRQSGTQMPLVIAGPVGWHGEAIAHAVTKVAGVILLPFQPRARLLDLIAGARALLFPSLVEGFGLPLVEAMTFGTPLMTSATGALAEVAGDAAILVDPFAVSAMASVIAALAVDDRLCDRLRSAGLARALAFRVDDYASRVLALYAETMNRKEGADG